MNFKVPFDEYVKDRLEGFEPAVPSHIWDKINKEKNKKRPFAFWFEKPNFKLFGILFLLFIGSFGIIVFKNFNAENKLHNSFAKVNNNLDAANKTSKNNGLNKNGDNEIKVTTKNISERNESISAENFNNAITSNQKQTTTSSQKNNTNSSDFHHKRKQLFTKQKKGAQIFSGATDEGDVVLDNSSSVSKNNISNANSINNNNIESTIIESLESNKKEESLISLSNKITPHIIPVKKIELNIPCPTNNSSKGINYLEWYASTDFSIRNFSDTPQSAYLKLRKESTKSMLGFSAGMRYTHLFKSGFSIRTGINVSRTNETFTFTQGNILQTIYVTNGAGDTINTYQAQSTRYKTTYNKYTSLDIPLLVGYEITRGNYILNVNGGLIFNIYAWYKGDILDKNNQPLNVNSTQSQSVYQLNKNIGMGGLLALSFYYKLNDRYSILAEPSFRYNFSSILNKELSLKQTNHTAGVKVGIRMNLMNREFKK
jgi:hypothetical protein